MIILIQLIIFTSIWVIGLKIVTADDMLLQKLRVKAEEQNKKIFEPLILCPWCMPSIHSIVGYGFFFLIYGFQYDIKFVWLYPLCVMASSFMCGMIWTGYLTLNSFKNSLDWSSKYFENAQKHFYLKNTEVNYPPTANADEWASKEQSND